MLLPGGVICYIANHLLCRDHVMSKRQSTPSDQKFVLLNDNDGSAIKISFIVEWANTTYNGVSRFFGFLEIFLRQWRELSEGKFPAGLSREERALLKRIDKHPEFLLISGEEIDEALVAKIRNQCRLTVTPDIQVRDGLEYYALKNLGAELATGDILCFIDSDVYPEEGWMAFLLATFADSRIRAAAGQPYVAPVDLFSKAFALGWTYDLRDAKGRLFPTIKWYANNVAFVTTLYRQYGFPSLNRRTRGSAALLGEQLMNEGYPVWQNGRALVDHPAPSGWKHLVIRALAHGRDMYMKRSEERTLRGLYRSQKVSALRMQKGLKRTYAHWRDVGLRRWEVIPVVFILGSYYGLFSLGGILTHISPEKMGRRFRL